MIIDKYEGKKVVLEDNNQKYLGIYLDSEGKNDTTLTKRISRMKSNASKVLASVKKMTGGEPSIFT